MTQKTYDTNHRGYKTAKEVRREARPEPRNDQEAKAEMKVSVKRFSNTLKALSKL